MTPLSSSCPPSPSSSHHFIPHPLPHHQLLAAIDDAHSATVSEAVNRFGAAIDLNLPPVAAVLLLLYSLLLFFFFFFSFFLSHCVKKRKKKAKKPLYRVGWRHWEVLMFPQREACDWFSETSVTASWSLIGEESWAAINMDEGAMKGPM